MYLEMPMEMESRLQQEAERHQMNAPDYALHLLEQGLPQTTAETRPYGEATRALLAQWRQEAVNVTPEEIAAGEAEWEELQAALQAHPLLLRTPEL